jgi:hypothetical protein
VATCATVRHEGESSPLQASDLKSKLQRLGSPMRPSSSPSSASHRPDAT